ncbi:2-C-methyl-D-erythritol 4-phosphate cytidylyltransferase [uncultured Halopseudomonas sp.]|jgi:2-C-methyl-D-erythritol 4-phosphate cytidylyltransferase|uniref:2-C-methyl-D-erythritol 4-phosphate cytidylyltransferase n=1 Tax=uncultured Halopseudomonas sp. TaxID=2901193 RepID=UPI0030EB3061|tara:strand:- start:51065 stop:51760 length:696 start_codon:yes stop_codon:yes gene_type:complete
MNTPVSFWVVIPAAGIGSRMQADRPKQYLPLGDRLLIEHTLDCFLDRPGLKGLIVCLSAADRWWDDLDCATDTRIQRVLGGRDRADSVLAGLKALLRQGAGSSDWVLVHDAARPNLAATDLHKLLNTLADDPVGGLLAVPVRDTLKCVGADGRVASTPDRSLYWQAYTPQMFRLGALHDALTQALANGAVITDEASAMEYSGQAPRLVEGRSDNIKVTRPEDLEWLARLRD